MKKGDKAGQVSVYIIISIIIVAIIALLFFLLNNKEDERILPSTRDPDLKVIQGNIEDCMKTVSRASLKRIGLQGGYCNKPGKEYELDWAFIPYYYDKGEIILPAKEKIETELGICFDDKFKLCMDELKFKNYEIKYSSPKTKASIAKSRVMFTVDMPLSIVKEGKTTTALDLKRYPVDLNSSLYEMIEVSNFITNSHKEDPELLCINCVVSMAKERNLYTDLIAFPYQNRTTLIMLSENRTYSEPYVFEFLNRYG
jgi:hypothetical protein